MAHIRKLIPALGILLWWALIMVFNRHELAIYAITALFSLSMTFLALSQTGPRYVEIKIDNMDDEHV